MARIKDVAELAGVNRSTVSRIINGEGKFREETKMKVEQAMAELNYRPSAIARSLATSSSNMVGLLVTYYTGGFFGEMMEKVQGELDSHSKFLITAQGHNTAEGEREAIQRFHDLRCDGYVLHSRYLSDDELRELAKQPTPFVLLDREVEGLEDRCVTFDHHAASAMAVSRLIDLGHREIGCISGPHSRYNSLRRKQGYVDTMEQSGLPVLETYIEEGNYGRHSGYVAAETLFKNNPHLTALFSCSEEMTVGALQYLHENGIKVPDQVSVMSFDSVDLCEATYPKVSAVHFPISQMARTAVECLMNLTNRIEHSGERHFSAELRIRQADKPI